VLCVAEDGEWKFQAIQNFAMLVMQFCRNNHKDLSHNTRFIQYIEYGTKGKKITAMQKQD